GPGAWRPGWGWYRPGWGWGYYDNGGAWIALGVASGLALGAVAATAEPVYGDDAVAYCIQRFRSYNPATGTYTGYDGYQHPCP
ncbi:BA14K family protein, partial [Xanthobacter autotrophicus]|uniref:BA14K family protein n=1 Tax=Xanthobacter autotrophicus TaxID=280 RepID=UPI0024A648E7